MTRKMAADGRVIPRHGRDVCGEHRTRDNERATRALREACVGDPPSIELGKH